MPQFSIIFENNDIILINKPFGVSVQGGKGILHPLDEELSKQVGYKVHLVHRLDKDTAGILLVAKNSSAASKWSSILSSGMVKKEYTALCIGSLHGEHTLNGSVIAHKKEVQAVLKYKVLKNGFIILPSINNSDSNTDCPQTEKQKIDLSLVNIVLGTGRMHQIRIQMAQAGAPLVADDQHGDFKKNKMLRKLGINKLCLASTKLSIPLENTLKTFEIPLPPHIENALSILL